MELHNQTEPTAAEAIISRRRLRSARFGFARAWNHFPRGKFSPGLLPGNKRMRLSNESLIVILIVGMIAGWLAGQVVRGAGFGLVGDLFVGIIGAFIGDWLLPQIGLHFGVGTIALIVNATIDRKSTRLNSSHTIQSRMPSSA